MTPASSAPATYPTGVARAILLITAVSCAILELIDTTVVNVSLREISGNIGATTTEIAWVITAYSIANVIVIPLSGMLSNLFGRKLYFTSSVAIFTFSSLMCGFSGNLWMLVFWRFVQGIGGGGLLSTSQSIIMDAFPPEERATGLMVFGLGVILGPAFGPVLGGYITDHLSWHWIFFLNVPIGVIAAFLSWKFVSDLAGVEKPRIDVWGIVFLAVGIGSLQYILEEGTTADWFSSNDITFFFILAIIGLILFVIRELSISYPAVNLRLYGNFNLAMGSLMNFIVGIIMTGTLFIFPLFVQVSLGWTATQTGAFMIPGMLMTVVGMVIAKKSTEKGVHPKIIILTGLGLTVLYLVMLSFSSPESNSGDFFWPFMIRGVGAVMMVVPVLGLATAGLTGKNLAQAVGLSNMLRQLGGAFGVALLNIYLSHENAYVRNNMIPAINPYNPLSTDYVNGITQSMAASGYGPDESAQLAMQLTDTALTRQQLLVSYNHGFMIVGLIMLLAVPLILMIRYKKSSTPASVADAH
ncbi:DHA2 family efflux MFS transporter permease subunit [Chitinophaga arvensicola]|uniref:MFS transporter, DHA2 family, multidrug resistance protein n=1 Tax=Chitinophaga arvensicola TaxID=29529 RepID=A0A1I0S8Y4_9BACT|nr:DHA2 family efflux MFS transporter permease subunit [Chitinophaga arvensicola]SEW52612.1 MFS transporter, DHA2 family, multidrug resistance protein [Chitinophaga arvensicola]